MPLKTMNLQLTQEVLMHRIFNNSSSQQCCPDGHLTLNGSFERRIRTSLGEFKMDFWRVRWSKCGKTFAPLAKFIGLECYQIKKTVGSAPIQIMPDGTGFKGSGVDGQARKGDLKVVIGISQHGNIFFWLQKPGQLGKILLMNGIEIKSHSSTSLFPEFFPEKHRSAVMQYP